MLDIWSPRLRHSVPKETRMSAQGFHEWLPSVPRDDGTLTWWCAAFSGAEEAEAQIAMTGTATFKHAITVTRWDDRRRRRMADVASMSVRRTPDAEVLFPHKY